MVYADGSNPSVRKDIGVRLPFPALTSQGRKLHWCRIQALGVWIPVPELHRWRVLAQAALDWNWRVQAAGGRAGRSRQPRSAKACRIRARVAAGWL